MMQVSASATFRLASKTLSVDEICDVMGMQPTRSFAIGEVFSRRANNPKRREENLWLLDSTLSPDTPLSEHLEELSGIIFSRRRELERSAEQLDMRISCSFCHNGDHGGFAIAGFVLRRFEGLTIDMMVDVYAE